MTIWFYPHINHLIIHNRGYSLQCLFAIGLIISMTGCCQKNQDAQYNKVNILELGKTSDDPTYANWFRVYNCREQVWIQFGNVSGPGGRRREIDAICRMYLKRTNREELVLNSVEHHARLWVVTFVPNEPIGTYVGGGVTLWIDSKEGKVVAETRVE